MGTLPALAGEGRGEGPPRAFVVAWATWLRSRPHHRGPDLDVDGYAHFQIARRARR
ncbi:MAG: hypothetical protein U0326_02850 [Polyangiales bacterium]